MFVQAALWENQRGKRMYCWRCGREVRDGMAFCPACGQKVEAPEVKPEAPEAKPEEAAETAKADKTETAEE